MYLLNLMCVKTTVYTLWSMAHGAPARWRPALRGGMVILKSDSMTNLNTGLCCTRVGKLRTLVGSQ